ncbi:hypothetical protein [Archangium sp.]|uniref:hypothetical protein n=1 Tax=Archangium sp. TaxID=1872627 RepID=UPI00286A1575|nr:hypothetical protein [Archangium sp.]
MRAEAWAPRWAVPLAAVLLSTGCVTLAPRQAGDIAEGPRALSTWREAGGRTAALETPAPLESTRAGEHSLSAEPGERERLHRRRGARGLGPDAALASSGEAPAYEMASVGTVPEGRPSCGGQEVPPGWPDFSSNNSEALLAPFLTCTSPGEFVALQQRVDMPRLVETLDDWHAVRLGALGPVREDAAHLLQRKRAAFLVSTTRRYGVFYAEVFALYALHSAYDDEVDEVLRLLAGDKQLGRTLAPMPAVHEELERRGMPLSRYPDRAVEGWDVLRGAGRAAWDVASTSPTMDGILYTEMTARRARLPPPYQQALLEVEHALALRHFAPDSVAVGSFDAVTFGVPLGFYYLAVGTGHGLYSLTRGEYEQATRELAPVALLAATLSMKGKGTRPLDKAWGGGAGFQRGLETVRARVGALAERTRQLQAQLGTGVEGLRELARYIQASREAGRFVAVGGAEAALALYEARGNVPKARPLMSKAKPEASGSPPSNSGDGARKAAVADDAARPSATKTGAAERPGTLASLVNEGVGHTREVVKAKLTAAELEATGPRLPKDVSVLEKHCPSLDGPPPPEVQGNPRWREYVDYYEERLREVKEGTAAEGPLKWGPYEQLRGWFARGMAFEADMVKLLRADAKKPRAERRFLGDFDKPRIETSVGVKKPGPGLRYADVLVIEEGELGGQPRRVEAFSFKSRDLSGLNYEALKAQMIADAGEALQKYGERLDIRRDSLQRLFGEAGEVQVLRVRLIYEGGALNPTNPTFLDAAVSETKRKVPGVEVLFQ